MWSLLYYFIWEWVGGGTGAPWKVCLESLQPSLFDVEMDFTGNASYVAKGHLMGIPWLMTYMLVVSWDIKRIELMIVALQNVYILSENDGNVYLNVACRGNIWCGSGPEFGWRQVLKVLISRALYDIKISGTACGYHLLKAVQGMGLKSCHLYSSMWTHKDTEDDVFTYW